MRDDTVIKTVELAEGRRVVIVDDTRHYFGGYYDVRLLVQADVAPVAEWFECEADYESACKRLGPMVRFTRVLRKMAVPMGEIEQTRRSLLENFESHLLPYLSRTDFPQRFVLSEYEKSRKPNRLLIGSYGS